MNRFERIENDSNLNCNNTDIERTDEVKGVGNDFDVDFDSKELEYLDRNTAASDKCEVCDCFDHAYSEEELQELYDDFAGYINEDVRFEFDGEQIEGKELPSNFGEHYKQTGLHQVSWNKDLIEGTEQAVVLPVGARIIQYSHAGASGRFFAPEGSEYVDLQLPDSEDRRVLNTYEVLQSLPVLQSDIAKQYFTIDAQSDSGNRIQYRSEYTADELEKSGILKRINSGEDTK